MGHRRACQLIAILRQWAKAVVNKWIRLVMFGIGMPEMLVILAVALVVIGPSRLPEIARSIGRAYAEFSRSMRDVQRGFEDMTSEFDEERDMLNNPKATLSKAVETTFAEPDDETRNPASPPSDRADS